MATKPPTRLAYWRVTTRKITLKNHHFRKRVTATKKDRTVLGGIVSSLACTLCGEQKGVPGLALIDDQSIFNHQIWQKNMGMRKL